TVGTATELADYLRVLYARIGRVHCPRCHREARADAPDRVADELCRDEAGARALVTFPLPVPKEPAAQFLRRLAARRLARVGRGKGGGEPRSVTPPPAVELPGPEEIEVVLDGLAPEPARQSRLAGSLEQAFREGGGRAVVEVLRDGQPPVLHRYGDRFGCHA